MDGDGPALFAPRGDLPATAILLGAHEDVTYFAESIEDPEGAPLADLRTAGPQQSAGMASLMALARAMTWWHARHRYCGACGCATTTKDGGFRLRCDRCSIDHHPRVDPAMIVLVTRGDACLLARSARFPPGMYSTLAGYVEPGESLEDCVVREVFEEVGLRVDEVRYFGSQPWPFPQSLMLGFVARSVSTELTLDPEEIEDARWVSREVLADERRWENFWVPPPFAIARRLMEHWLSES